MRVYHGLFSSVIICAKSLQLCPTLCDPMDHSQQAPLSMGFSRQKYWSGLPFPPPGDLPDPGVEPASFTSCITGGLITTSATWEAIPCGRGLQKGTDEVRVQFSRSVVSDSLQPHELQHARPTCPSPTPGVHSDSRPSSQ